MPRLGEGVITMAATDPTVATVLTAATDPTAVTAPTAAQAIVPSVTTIPVAVPAAATDRMAVTAARGGTVIESAPVESESKKPAAEPNAKEAVKPPQNNDSANHSHKVYLTVEVPTDAKVFVNGKPTTTRGTTRTYVSSGTRSGQQYKYEIRAELDQDGTNQVESQVVYAGAGDHPTVKFELGPPVAEGQIAEEPLPQADPPKTTLKIKVPGDAEVFLAGNKTTSTGPNRVFQTNQLRAGQHWDGYTIRAEVIRGGKTIVREQKISLQAGETRELTLDLPSVEVATVAVNR